MSAPPLDRLPGWRCEDGSAAGNWCAESRLWRRRRSPGMASCLSSEKRQMQAATLGPMPGSVHSASHASAGEKGPVGSVQQTPGWLAATRHRMPGAAAPQGAPRQQGRSAVARSAHSAHAAVKRGWAHPHRSRCAVPAAKQRRPRAWPGAAPRSRSQTWRWGQHRVKS